MIMRIASLDKRDPIDFEILDYAVSTIQSHNSGNEDFPPHVPLVEPVNLEGREERRAADEQRREKPNASKLKLSRRIGRSQILLDPDLKLKMRDSKQLYWQCKKRKGLNEPPLSPSRLESLPNLSCATDRSIAHYKNNLLILQ